MPENVKEEGALNAIRKFAFGPILSILGTIIVLQLNDLKSDVKTLLQSEARNSTRIDNLERQVYKITPTELLKSDPSDKTLLTSALISPYYIHEENLDIKKYLKKTRI